MYRLRQDAPRPIFRALDLVGPDASSEGPRYGLVRHRGSDQDRLGGHERDDLIAGRRPIQQQLQKPALVVRFAGHPDEPPGNLKPPPSAALTRTRPRSRNRHGRDRPPPPSTPAGPSAHSPPPTPTLPSRPLTPQRPPSQRSYAGSVPPAHRHRGPTPPDQSPPPVRRPVCMRSLYALACGRVNIPTHTPITYSEGGCARIRAPSPDPTQRCSAHLLPAWLRPRPPAPPGPDGTGPGGPVRPFSRSWHPRPAVRAPTLRGTTRKRGRGCSRDREQGTHRDRPPSVCVACMRCHVDM